MGGSGMELTKGYLGPAPLLEQVLSHLGLRGPSVGSADRVTGNVNLPLMPGWRTSRSRRYLGAPNWQSVASSWSVSESTPPAEVLLMVVMSDPIST